MKKKSNSLQNILIVSLGIITIIIGFICLGQGPANNPVSLTIAPLILAFAYLVIIPVGIIYSGKSKETEGD